MPPPTCSAHLATGTGWRSSICSRPGRTPVSVEEFIDPLGLSQPTVSYHLRKLAEAGLLDRRQQGQRAHYSLNKEALRTLAAVADLKGGC